jgi:hypothetical protein
VNAKRVLLCLVVTWCASPLAAGAQTAGAQTPGAGADSAKAWSCVDPSDVSARRWFQDEPCKWPMYHLPEPSAEAASEPRSLPTFPQPPAGAQAGHAMFWRFPVQPRGPYDAPRHGFR